MTANDSFTPPFGTRLVVGQTQPGDRVLDSVTGRWRRLKPEWPLVAAERRIIRRCTQEQTLIPDTAEATGTPTDLFDDMQELPTISVIWDDDTEEFVLLATSHGSTAPAGERLFHSDPVNWPVMKFRNDTRAEAEEAARILTAHIAAWPKRTKPKPSEARL